MSQWMNRANTQALMIDMQVKLTAAMPDREELIQNTQLLIKSLQILGIPITVSQQYTKGLGQTDSRLMEEVGLTEYLDKITYSCFADPGIRAQLEKEADRKTILLFGIESHICVWQTAQDLLAEGYRVEIVCDCVSSRKEKDREIALRRMEAAGMILTTREACIYELLEQAGTADFKKILPLIK